ncbi:MAG TPA: hypothetical protein VG206_17610 [Terriglobia bacterium]|nr:hypothetical protein [Terriglobia bacterium]
MTRFLHGNQLWNSIRRRARAARRKRVAIAYFTRATDLGLKAGDVLIVDASDGAIASGQTSASVLATLRRKGVELYSHNGLHAKIVIADHVLFASSANASESSFSRLLDAGVETDSPNAVAGAIGLIQTLVERSVPIDKAFISRIKRIKVLMHFSAGKSKVRAEPSRQREPITWLVGVHDIDLPTNPAELRRIESGEAKAEEFLTNSKSGVSWIRYGRKQRIGNTARRGDSLVIMKSPTAATSPNQVYRHTTVLHRQKEPNCTRVFYEEAPGAERQRLSWAEFKRLARIARLPKNLSENTTRPISDKASDDLNHYWNQVRRKRVAK